MTLKTRRALPSEYQMAIRLKVILPQPKNPCLIRAFSPPGLALNPPNPMLLLLLLLKL